VGSIARGEIWLFPIKKRQILKDPGAVLFLPEILIQLVVAILKNHEEMEIPFH
jgi:hypothetical protein